MYAKQKIEAAINAIHSASAMIGMLPEQPYTNGSILLIDDVESERIVNELDEAAVVLGAEFADAAQTLASNADEIARLREVLMNVKATLVIANEKPDGPIVDTIWHSGHETLFDYIDSSFTPQPTE
jgi:hypothetical protein